MPRKIMNPFTGRENYHCFACSPDNPYGLHLQFIEAEEYVECEWIPGMEFQGFNNILHGGIQATLLDETAAWAVMIKLGTSGVTTGMEVKYKKPVRMDEGSIFVRARISSATSRTASLRVEIADSTGKICTEALIDFYLYPEEKARKELFYPGQEAFFRQQ